MTQWTRLKANINNPTLIYLSAALASLLLSLWMAYREVVINPDAICYLQSASVIGNGGLRKAMNLCSQAQWPLYSVLIYFCSLITQLSLIHSAYFLDAIFSVISVVIFVKIVEELGGKGRVLWFAAATILLAHEFNSVRQYIIRDHGFWAFYLTSLLLLLRYFSTFRWTYALAWSVSLLAATLFRIEGIAFLMLLPWVVWFGSTFTTWQRIKGFFSLNLIAFSAGLAVFGWLIFHPEISLASLGRLQEFVFQLFHAFGMVWQRFQASAAGVAQMVLTPDSKHEAPLVLFLALVTWYVVKVIANLSIVYSGLTVYALWKKALPLKDSARLVLWGYVVSNIIITSLFLAEHLFLSKRYLIAFSLVLMVWVPFALDKLIAAWQMRKLPKWAMPTVISLFLISAIGGIFDFGYSKAYIRDAGAWLSENVPSSSDLYSNDYQLMYYSQHFGNEIFSKIKEYNQANALTRGKWRYYDYVALRLSKRDENRFETELKIKPVQVFANKRGDQIRIYKIED